MSSPLNILIIFVRGEDNYTEGSCFLNRFTSLNNLGEINMDITGMLAIGNGEKCPFCDIINTKDFDILKHMIEDHGRSINKALFGDKK